MRKFMDARRRSQITLLYSGLLSVAALFVIRRNLGIIRGTIHNSGTGTVRERGKYRDLEWVIDVPE